MSNKWAMKLLYYILVRYCERERGARCLCETMDIYFVPWYYFNAIYRIIQQRREFTKHSHCMCPGMASFSIGYFMQMYVDIIQFSLYRWQKLNIEHTLKLLNQAKNAFRMSWERRWKKRRRRKKKHANTKIIYTTKYITCAHRLLFIAGKRVSSENKLNGNEYFIG